jgi:hypothetical protein
MFMKTRLSVATAILLAIFISSAGFCKTIRLEVENPEGWKCDIATTASEELTNAGYTISDSGDMTATFLVGSGYAVKTPGFYSMLGYFGIERRTAEGTVTLQVSDNSGNAVFYKSVSVTSGTFCIFCNFTTKWAKTKNQSLKKATVELVQDFLQDSGGISPKRAAPVKPKKAAKTYEEWFDEGNAAFDKGNYEKAADVYEQAAELKDDDPSLFYNMGLCYANLGDNDKAIANYKKYLDLDPQASDSKDVKNTIKDLQQK